jgi:hypothetical protein
MPSVLILLWGPERLQEVRQQPKPTITNPGYHVIIESISRLCQWWRGGSTLSGPDRRAPCRAPWARRAPCRRPGPDMRRGRGVAGVHFGVCGGQAELRKGQNRTRREILLTNSSQNTPDQISDIVALNIIFKRCEMGAHTNKGESGRTRTARTK